MSPCESFSGAFPEAVVLSEERLLMETPHPRDPRFAEAPVAHRLPPST